MLHSKENVPLKEIERINGALPVSKNGSAVNLKLHLSNVSYTLKKSANSQKIKILNDICGEFRSGRLTAILGPSGAGKSSLLNVLSGFKSKGVTGKFSLNEQPINLCAFRKISSYIPQDFAMLDLLTVQETLQISADLKLPPQTGATQKQTIINDILQILNMKKCQNTLVQQLSGGERKRLSIGVELVTNPSVMFFDEPTSGLDSVASLQLINYLRRLAYDGRIIVCVIHQPSSRLMKLFDDVLVMSMGQLLYAGQQTDLIEHFEQSNFSFPKYYNPADFVLEVASQQHDENVLSLIQRNRQRHDRDSTKILEEDEKTNMLPPSTEHSAIVVSSSDDYENQNVCDFDLRPKEQVSVLRQFSVLFRRTLRTMSRNLIAVQMRFVMHVVIAALLGILFWDIGNDASKVLTNSSCIFFLVMFAFFGNAMPSILLCPQETTVFVREYLNGWYSIKAYYLSKIVAEIPMQLICPTLFIGIVYYMTGQPNELARFCMCWSICLFTANIGHFYGLLFGSFFDLQMSIFLVPVLAIPLMLFSGFFIRVHEVAAFLRPLCDFSFFRYTMEGFMQAIYGYQRDDLICDIDFCYFKSPKKFLQQVTMLDARYGFDVMALFLWIVGLQVLFFLSLVYRIRRAL